MDRVPEASNGVGDDIRNHNNKERGTKTVSNQSIRPSTCPTKFGGKTDLEILKKDFQFHVSKISLIFLIIQKRKHVKKKKNIFNYTHLLSKPRVIY
jgi:hypothetical protein